jgi:hypothetical protein
MQELPVEPTANSNQHSLSETVSLKKKLKFCSYNCHLSRSVSILYRANEQITITHTPFSTILNHIKVNDPEAYEQYGATV